MSESLQRNAGGQRNTGLDLLRLLAICMVIVLHYNYFRMGGLLGAVAPKETNYYLGQTTETFSIIACNLFVLISAYYLSAANRVKVRKVVDISLMLVFYGLLCLAVAYAFGLAPTEATFADLMKSILNRWFVVTYVILYLIFPFLNRVIRSISRRKHLYLIWLAFIFFSVWPSVYTKVTVSDKGYGITNFILLYLIAAYIRRYADGRKRWGVLIPAYLGSVALTVLIQLYPSYAEGSFRDFMDFVFMGKALNYNFFLNTVSSVLLFLIFKNLSLGQSRAVTKLQGFSLSVLDGSLNQNHIRGLTVLGHLRSDTLHRHRLIYPCDSSFLSIGVRVPLSSIRRFPISPTVTQSFSHSTINTMYYV